MVRLLSVLASAIVLMAMPVYADYEMAEMPMGQPMPMGQQMAMGQQMPMGQQMAMGQQMPMGQQMAMGQQMPMGQQPVVMDEGPAGGSMQPMPPMQMMEPMPGYQLPASAGYRPKPLDSTGYAATGAPHRGRHMGRMAMGPKQITKCKTPMCAPMPQACGPMPCGPPMCMPQMCPQPLAWY
jgi:hypothetical protein